MDLTDEEREALSTYHKHRAGLRTGERCACAPCTLAASVILRREAEAHSLVDMERIVREEVIPEAKKRGQML